MINENNTEIYNRVVICFNGNLEAIKNFVIKASKYNELEIRSGRWTVDPRSLMGMFSLDLSEPVSLYYPKSIEDNVFEDFGGYIIKVI